MTLNRYFLDCKNDLGKKTVIICVLCQDQTYWKGERLRVTIWLFQEKYEDLESRFVYQNTFFWFKILMLCQKERKQPDILKRHSYQKTAENFIGWSEHWEKKVYIITFI